MHTLLILSRWGPLTDPRLDEAIDIIKRKRLPDGCWQAEGFYWRPPGKTGSNVDVVDWGKGANVMITVNALRVLRAAGR